MPAPEGFDYYLIKLDGVSAEARFKETENFGRLEYSFSLLAKECGIEMTDCSLIEENGRAHFLTKRFDRANGEKSICRHYAEWPIMIFIFAVHIHMNRHLM